MTTVTLPPDLDEVLGEKAKKKGTTTEMLVIDELRERHLSSSTPEQVEGETLYDSLKDFIGCVDSSRRFPGGSNASEKTGEQFTDIIMQKYRAGKL